MSGRLDGKVAVITGGASGMGAATVRKFVAEGARVVIADVQEEKGRELAEDIGPDAVFAFADVCREADVQGMIDAAAHRVRGPRLPVQQRRLRRRHGRHRDHRHGRTL